MNTILTTGTVNTYTGKGNIFTYNVSIWGNMSGNDIEYITGKEIFATCYGDFWQQVKQIAVKYFKDEQLLDGAYTRFLDSLITI